MIPLWTTTEEINRPKLPYEYDPLGGCQKDRQFMAFRADVVGARAFGHWCEACCKVQGPGKGGMDSGKKEGKSMVMTDLQSVFLLMLVTVRGAPAQSSNASPQQAK